MSNQKRRRNRKPGGGSGSNDGPKSSGASRGSRKPRKEPAADAAEFWGDASRLPDPIRAIAPVPDVKAVVTSLGRPPVTGHETAAEHWFSMVYERAAVLAGALAAAGDLQEADESSLSA